MYRVRSTSTLAAQALLLFALAVAPTGLRAGQVAMQAPESIPVQAFEASFGDLLEARIRAVTTPELSAQDKAWLAQMRSFYLARGGQPVWVKSGGWNERARTVLAELAAAGDWGLDPAVFDVDELQALGAQALTQDALAHAEISLSQAVVKYVHHARGGRIDPSSLSLWLDRTPDPVFATAVLMEAGSAEDAAAVLRASHPAFPEFEALREAYIDTREAIENPKGLPDDVVLETPGEVIKVGEWHPDVVKVRKRLGVAAEAGFESRFDDKLANALDDFLTDRKVRVRWGRIDAKARNVLNRPPPPPTKDDLLRIQANMERWRWLPRDLGAFHIWNNLPEMETRVVKNGEVILRERIIVGQPDTQTPVFSDRMRQIVFQPEWGVPPSIKVNDLLPKLQAGDYEVLERRNMRILGLSGKELRPTRFNWEKVDIRDVGIYQRSGDANPLGVVKFLFPNKHHVYMHDTNNRALFSASDRFFSHGCVRVRAPDVLAKLILREDKGWDDAQVVALLKNTKKPNNRIELERPFPVHNVYFTILPGPDGKLTKLYDVYGHDRRVIQALSGVPASRIAASDPARNQLREIEEAAPPQVRKANRARAEASDDENDD